MHIPLLTDLVILLVVSVGVLYVSHHVRLPAIVGFLISGVLVGPDGLALVQNVEEVEQLAEIGVILLLFTIGLEFSMDEFLRLRRIVALGGSLQVGIVTVATFVILMLTGMPANQALFLGMIASLSSTAVVLTVLQERGEIDAPQGRVSFSMLVYQDMMIVPMMLLVPVLAGSSGGIGSALVGFVAKSLAALVAVVALGRFVVPQLLSRVVGTRSRDLFLMTVVTICLAVAWGSALAGLSLALGAFLAGLLISESEYSHQALADILPFRDLFAAFFFVSIGMLLDLGLVTSRALPLAGLMLAVLALKTVAAAVATSTLGFSARTAVQTGLSMSQVGEFSFVLAGAGLTAGLLEPGSYRWFVAAAVGTIGLTPFLIRASGPMSEVLDRLPLPNRVRDGTVGREHSSQERELSEHVVVVGHGVNGRNVMRATYIAGIPAVAVDANPSVVEAGREAGIDIRYGDATRKAVLERLGVGRARAVVVAISDAAATRRITALSRALNPTCAITARTRYVREMDALTELGATNVIPEELETSVEIVSRLLTSYLIPRAEIESFVSEIRADGYQILRSRSRPDASLHDLHDLMTDVQVTTLRVGESSPIAGRRLADTDLRRLYGVSVVAIRRGESLFPNPGGDEVIRAGDLLVVLGLGEEVAAASVLFRDEGAPEGAPVGAHSPHRPAASDG